VREVVGAVIINELDVQKLRKKLVQS
jgi:hypothetical protein